MTWIKLEDEVADHPKIAGLSDRAFRWWIRSLCYCSRFLTDGAIPAVFLFGIKPNIRAELIGAKLWIERDSRIEIHDYLTYQTSRTEVEKERERNRNRRNSAGRTAGTTAGTPNGCTEEKPPPEGREQRTDTESREQRVSAPSARPAPVVPIIDRRENINYAKKHGYHVHGFCDWVCLDEQQAAEFAAKIPGDDHALKLKQIREWALDVRANWQGRIVPDGSHFDFWRNRWTETHGGSKPANATLKAAKAAADLDEAFR